jgi:hypothetical protein
MLSDSVSVSSFGNDINMNGWYHYEDTHFIEKRHYKNGLIHNENEPAIYIIPNKNIENNQISPSYHYYYENKKHNKNGPSDVYYFSNDHSTIEYISYNIFGKFHRIDGPAVIHFNHDGSSYISRYYFHDKLIFKDRLLKIVQTLKKRLHIRKCKKVIKVRTLLRKTPIYDINGPDIVDYISTFI